MSKFWGKVGKSLNFFRILGVFFKFEKDFNFKLKEMLELEKG